jgi:hypothetical protein
VNHAATVDLARAALDSDAERFVFASKNLVYGPGRGRRRARATNLRRLTLTRRASSRRRTCSGRCTATAGSACA